MTARALPLNPDVSRVPPHDLNAEAAVISAVLVDESALEKIRELRPDQFYSEAHRRIFEACVAVNADGRPVDVVTVATHLRDHERLAQVGGMAYLTEILNAAPAVANVRTYATTVNEKWRARRIVLLGQRLSAQALAGHAPDALATSAQTDLEQISRTSPGESFRIWTGADVWAPLEAPDYLIGRLCVRGTLALIVAYGSSLKTWLLADSAIAIPTGGNWLHRFDTKPGRALLIDFESGDWELRRRVHRIAAGRELAIPIDGFGFVTMPSLSLADDGFYAALAPLAREYAFIGIDSLAAGSGGIDENDARFARSLQRLKAIASETKCVIVLLHHSRKGGGDEADPREMVRGSSAIFNACDVVLMMSRNGDDGFVVRQTKARGGKAVEPFVVRVEDIGEDASIVVARDVADEGEEDVAKGSKAIEKAKRTILMLLAAEHDVRSATEVWRRVRGNKKVCLDALRELEERDLVTKSAGAYRLASEVRQ